MTSAGVFGQETVVISTAIVSVFSGFLLGVYAIRGYLFSPEMVTERMANYVDPVESDESDIDEDDTILDHAPNWSNGEAADKRDGLRVEPKEGEGKGKGKSKSKKEIDAPKVAIADSDEDCKLVLVVRTDLGMTKGERTEAPCPFFFFLLPSHPLRTTPPLPVPFRRYLVLFLRSVLTNYPSPRP